MKNKIFLFVALFLCVFQASSLLAEDVVPGPELPAAPAVLPTAPETVVPPVAEKPVDEKKEEAPEAMMMSFSVPAPVLEIISTSTVRLIVKKNSEIIFDQLVEIPDEQISFDASGESKTISRQTALGAMLYADSLSEEFAFTDIDYYSGLGYLVNCLNIPSIDTADVCYDWHYGVNGDYPNFAVDLYNLKNDDLVYLYFEKSERLTFPRYIQLNKEFVIIAESYDYVNDNWNKIVDRIIGVIKTSGWSYVEIATSTTDVNGEVKFSLGADDGYNVGLYNKSDWGDYYSPTYSLVFGTTTTATTTTNNSGGGSSSTNKTFIEKAIEFLLLKQENGSFGLDLYTDWAAIAFGSVDESNSSLENYLKTDSVGSELTDIVRRSMALMSLGINPQTEYKEDLIEKILGEYKNNQFGDESEYNDDIFAILVLANMGFEYDDERIKNSIEFIIRSNPSGDLKQAAIQALKNYSGNRDVDIFLKSAKNCNISLNENIYSITWKMLGVSSLCGGSENFEKALEYLETEQGVDGGLLANDSEDNRIWSTAYAISAASGNDWNDILEDFDYEGESNADSEIAGGGLNDIATTTSTSTPAISTTTVAENNVDETAPLQAPQVLSLSNQKSDIQIENGLGDGKVDRNADENNQENGGEIVPDSDAINSTTKINFWYLAGGVLFALIAVLIFRK